MGNIADRTQELRAVLEAFLARAQRPAVLEAGLAPLELAPDRHALHESAGGLRLEVWDDTRQWSRRILSAGESRYGLELEAERFPARTVKLALVDLDHPRAETPLRRSARENRREHLRTMLRRQYAGWALKEISAAPDLEHSLAAGCPRALLKRGGEAVAAILGRTDADGTLTAALLWLDYLRQRDPELRVETLALFVPPETLGAVCLILKALDPRLARFSVFAAGAEGEVQVDPRDYGNLASELQRPPEAPEVPDWLQPLTRCEAVATVPAGGDVSFRIHGLEFARWDGAGLWCGVERKERSHGLDAAVRWAERVARIRRDDPAQKEHAWYRRAPEAWLESLVKAEIDTLDAALDPSLVHGQVVAREGLGAGIADLLARDRDGRLAVVELKASEDPRLPLQALDYWVRITRHAEAGTFEAANYFPGRIVRPAAPRLLLVSPALDFHPTTERLLRYLDPRVEVERIGLGLEWRRAMRVAFRVRGAARPEWSGAPA